MRTIKFRAWLAEGKMAFFDLWSGQDAFYLTADFPREAKKKAKIMQYTGLKDKNGVDIYEGDILDNWDYIEDAHCAYYLGRSVIEYTTGLPGFGGFIGEQVEVIGNIYQNPELLKEE